MLKGIGLSVLLGPPIVAAIIVIVQVTYFLVLKMATGFFVAFS